MRFWFVFLFNISHVCSSGNEQNYFRWKFTVLTTQTLVQVLQIYYYFYHVYRDFLFLAFLVSLFGKFCGFLGLFPPRIISDEVLNNDPVSATFPRLIINTLLQHSSETKLKKKLIWSENQPIDLWFDPAIFKRMKVRLFSRFPFLSGRYMYRRMSFSFFFFENRHVTNKK